MSIDLQIIERDIHEDITAKADTLSPNVTNIALEEVEKNLWISLVQTREGKFEGEIAIRGQRITNYYCECGDPELCGHLLLAMYKLREKLADPVVGKDISQGDHNSSVAKLTVGSILNEISEQELHEWLRKVTKSNIRFARLLKLEFIHRIQVEDSAHKYSNLLAGIAGKQFANNRKMPIRVSGDLINAIKHLLSVAEDLMEEKNFLEVLELHQAIPFYLFKALNLNPDKKGQLETLLHEWHLLTQRLLTSDMAPAIHRNLMEFCQETYLARWYLYDGNPNLLTILEDKVSREKLGILLSKDAGRATSSSPESSLQLHQILVRQYKYNQAISLLEEYEEDGEILSRLLSHLSGQMADQLEDYLGHILGRAKPATKQTVIKLLLKNKMLPQSAELIQHLKKCLLDNPQIVFLDAILAAARKGTESILRDLIDTVPELPKYKKLKGHLIFRLNRPHELFSWLKNQDLDIVLLFSKPHLGKFETDLSPILVGKVQKFLSEHIGPVAVRKMLEVIELLEAEGAVHLKKEVLTLLKTKFPERKLLQKQMIGRNLL